MIKNFKPVELVIAGWTGRDEAALKKHIKELEELGVKPPKTTPIFYRVAASLFGNFGEIQVSGPDTSGEVEFVLMQNPEGLFVTVGSDARLMAAGSQEILKSMRAAPGAAPGGAY